MKGHVIVERESKEGWIFVPDAHLRFNIIVLQKEAVISAVATYPDGTKGMWSSNLEEKIRRDCNFVTELEVPPEIVRWAQYAIERNRRWNDEIRKAGDRMRADGYSEEFPSSDVTDKYFGQVANEPKCPPELGLDADARFAVYHEVQGWILEAGGLV
ncbi:MAG: hypothetical protein HYS26_01725 [Candidatus Kaiserbacteria bacterium]|nr:MAG: hypothetical protein HYS26_01725 [Candidatus Kaiserbacteria bacterium]